MAKYKYNALNNNNQIVKGEIEASSIRDARDRIRKLGFVPTKVYIETIIDEDFRVENTSDTKKHVSEISFLSLDEKIMFTSELQVLLSSGIAIIEALATLETNTPKIKLKDVCLNLKNAIISGLTFAQALDSLYGKIFGPVYTAVIKTGEDSGELDSALLRMLVLLNKQNRVKEKIISASIYPAVLILIMLGVLILFSKFVFPAFMSVFTFNGAELPFLASMLVGICSFVGNFWWFILICFGAACGAMTALFKNPQFKSRWDEFILRVPVVSDFIQHINLSNFMTVLQISYDAGLPIMSGLELSKKTVGNYTIKNRITAALRYVKNGYSLSEAFSRTCAIPHALITMIATGEKSGTLGKMFHDAAEVLDKKVDIALDALMKLFEPALIVILGGTVLFIAVAFFQMYAGMLGTLF